MALVYVIFLSFILRFWLFAYYFDITQDKYNKQKRGTVYDHKIPCSRVEKILCTL